MTDEIASEGILRIIPSNDVASLQSSHVNFKSKALPSGS